MLSGNPVWVNSKLKLVPLILKAAISPVADFKTYRYCPPPAAAASMGVVAVPVEAATALRRLREPSAKSSYEEMVEVNVLTTQATCPVITTQQAAVCLFGTAGLTTSSGPPVMLYDDAVAASGKRFSASDTTTVPDGPKAKLKGVFPADVWADGAEVVPSDSTAKVSIRCVPFSVTINCVPSGVKLTCAGRARAPPANSRVEDAIACSCPESVTVNPLMFAIPSWFSTYTISP